MAIISQWNFSKWSCGTDKKLHIWAWGPLEAHRCVFFRLHALFWFDFGGQWVVLNFNSFKMASLDTGSMTPYCLKQVWFKHLCTHLVPVGFWNCNFWIKFFLRPMSIMFISHWNSLPCSLPLKMMWSRFNF